MEVNPNHPVTTEMRNQWHKLLAIVMHKNGLKDVEITIDDVAALGDYEHAVVADTRDGEFHVRLVTMEEGMKLAKTQGGFPV